jgi:3-phosphoshikimate 1-carboxyvinyltransferase
LTIQDPACVNKTFPEYFDVLSDVCAQAVDVIAIDGPTASGKGTVAARVAAALGYRYLDSGSLYRLLALYSLEKASAQGLSTVADAVSESALAAWALEMPVDFDGGRILLDGRDVSQAIRAEAIGNRASEVAALPEVRRSLLRRQRDWARPPGLVADGRDMGSVVFVNAATKIFLTATPEARAQRRVAQLRAAGIQADVATIAADLAARDARDAARPVAPLRFDPQSGAVRVDSTAQSIDETVEAVLAAHRSRPHGRPTI